MTFRCPKSVIYAQNRNCKVFEIMCCESKDLNHKHMNMNVIDHKINMINISTSFIIHNM
jgi:hypothetical protein